MLKFTYTESGLHLEYVGQSLEEWIGQRVVLSIRLGQPLMVEHGTASMLLLKDVIDLHGLEAALNQDYSGVMQLSICDADSVEVNFQGTWIASNPHEAEGVFVTTLSHSHELMVFQLWQTAQMHISSLSR